MTVRELISRSLKLVNIISSGETPTASEYQDALASLNSMIGSWSLQSLFINTKAREEFSLTSGQETYTIGDTGDFNTVRPTSILNLTYKLSNIEYPVDIITQQEYAQIADKTLSGLTNKAYVSGSYPLDTISLYPIPSQTSTLVVYSIKPLIEYTSLDTVISLPQGYERALIYNLAVEVAPEYGKIANDKIESVARESIADIKRINTDAVYMDASVSLINKNNVFDINRGY